MIKDDCCSLLFSEGDDRQICSAQTILRIVMLIRFSTKLKNSRTKTMMPRKCSNCGVTRTPQWREGPVGEV